MLTNRLKILPADKAFKKIIPVTKDANPDLINMYKQKFEEAIESGDKEEMKRWFREIMNHVSFTDAEDESGYDIRNIEKETTANDYFRKVIVTGKNLQLVLMSLLPNEDIGMEVHEDVDQFFRIDEGDGFCEIEGKGKTPIKDGSSIVIKAGTYHNIIAGDKGLKLYTIYAPPNHPPNRGQKTKADALAEEKGKTEDDSDVGKKSVPPYSRKITYSELQRLLRDDLDGARLLYSTSSDNTTGVFKITWRSGREEDVLVY
jgi:mannose-6-phosphate isomerase-like protein (cupin superfamily)